MLMTAMEARRTWCPMARQSTEGFPTYNRMEDGTVAESCLCVASDCMAWRWLGWASRTNIRASDGEDCGPEEVTKMLGDDEEPKKHERLIYVGYCGAFGRPEV